MEAFDILADCCLRHARNAVRPIGLLLVGFCGMKERIRERWQAATLAGPWISFMITLW